MADKFFTVTMEIAADSKDQVDKWIERMPHSDQIYDCKIVGEDDRHLEARIRYAENWCDDGEHYIFENKWSDEDDWGMEMAFKLMDYKEEKGVLLNYQALTLIRQWQNLHIPFHFA